MEKFQTLGPRFAALFIDGIIMIPFNSLAAMSTDLIRTHNVPKVSFILTNLFTLIPVIYAILLHAKYGQTLGKKVMKVKVLDISEKPITFTQAVIRSLPQMFPAFAGASLINISTRANPDYDVIQIAVIIITAVSWIWQIADIIVCFSSEKKRALHDLIAGTVVVKTDSNQISVTP